MIRLAQAEALRREIHQTDAPNLAISTWSLIHDAIQENRTNEALEFLNHELFIDKMVRGSHVEGTTAELRGGD